MNRHQLIAGKSVVVRSPGEIYATLDADGTLDGLPFMPEMLDWCGRVHRVERRVEKTCVDVEPPIPGHRRFAADDVVVLEGPRCDGSAHDGCKRGCKIFWKEAWLRPADSVVDANSASEPAEGQTLAPLRTKVDETHYFCQSTQLLQATEPFPKSIRGLWKLRIFAREIRNRDRSVPEIGRLTILWLWQRLLHRLHGDRWLRGPHRRTPVVSLDLRPGEPVRVKSRQELVATLDQNRSNRGLKVCYEATRACGARAEVRDRVDRLINERTGEMRQVDHTVTIHKVRGKLTARDMECVCADEPGDCPRGELMYWREIWLERLNGQRRDRAAEG